jgi:hypothetical protein
MERYYSVCMRMAPIPLDKLLPFGTVVMVQSTATTIAQSDAAPKRELPQVPQTTDSPLARSRQVTDNERLRECPEEARQAIDDEMAKMTSRYTSV